MTTFEAIMCLAATAAVIILAFGILVIIKKLNHIAEQHKSTWAHFDNVVSQLYGIKTEVGQTNGKIDGFIPLAKHLRQKADNLENAWACDVTSIVKYIKELTDIVDKMHRNLCVEIADKMVDIVYPPTYVTPCYAPDGICMNPHGDCINCPKRGDGGTWSTSTNIIKEDKK